MAHETEQQRHSPNRRQAKGAGRWRQRRRTKEEGYMFHVSWQHQDQVSVINALKFIKLH